MSFVCGELGLARCLLLFWVRWLFNLKRGAKVARIHDKEERAELKARCLSDVVEVEVFSVGFSELVTKGDRAEIERAYQTAGNAHMLEQGFGLDVIRKAATR